MAKGNSGSSGYAKINAGRKTRAQNRQITQYTSNPSSSNYTPF